MRHFFQTVKHWWLRDDGVAAAEAGLIFPLLSILLLGTFDMGNAILANQKTIRASQVTADLITRERTITAGGVSEAVMAGELALQPFPVDTYGVDITSVSFDDDGMPGIEFRQTVNMSPIADVLQRVEALAEPGGGVVVVAVEYTFEPVFAGFVINNIEMREIAFSRGRQSGIVEMADS